MFELPVETILSPPRPPDTQAGEIIGHSRERRSIRAFDIGRGAIRVSLIGGCHADEPVGPSMLRLLTAFLGSLQPEHPLLADIQWLIVPHVNPDGARRNALWADHEIETLDHDGEIDRAYDPALYVRHVVRELPGDDMEFGFPRSPSDSGARPENQAVAKFLAAAGPLHLHGSFHGMGFAPGPWFLIEPAWIDRTSEMRRNLRQKVRALRYPLFDVDRRGDKGFRRIDEGFSTRPDSGAMRDHFLALADEETAAKFRPSSMEFARSLGGDPMTLVSEMPLFLLPDSRDRPQSPVFKVGTEGMRQLHDQLRRLAAENSTDEARAEMDRLGIRAMPLRDQMRLQLAFLEGALNSVAAAAPWEQRG